MSELKFQIECIDEEQPETDKPKSENEENFDLRKKNSYKRISKEDNNGHTYNDKNEKKGLTSIKSLLTKAKRKSHENSLSMNFLSNITPIKKEKIDYFGNKKVKSTKPVHVMKINSDEKITNILSTSNKSSNTLQLKFNPQNNKSKEKMTEDLLTECIKNNFSFEKAVSILENENLITPTHKNNSETALSELTTKETLNFNKLKLTVTPSEIDTDDNSSMITAKKSNSKSSIEMKKPTISSTQNKKTKTVKETFTSSSKLTLTKSGSK